MPSSSITTSVLSTASPSSSLADSPFIFTPSTSGDSFSSSVFSALSSLSLSHSLPSSASAISSSPRVSFSAVSVLSMSADDASDCVFLRASSKSATEKPNESIDKREAWTFSSSSAAASNSSSATAFSMSCSNSLILAVSEQYFSNTASSMTFSSDRSAVSSLTEEGAKSFNASSNFLEENPAASN